MAKKTKRVPKYIRDALARQEAEEIRKRNRIPADMSEQVPQSILSARPHYEDVEFTCAECGRQEVWTSGQQKWWYEVAKGSIYSTAIRCLACRRALRKAHQGTPRYSHAARRRMEGT